MNITGVPISNSDGITKEIIERNPNVFKFFDEYMSISKKSQHVVGSKDIRPAYDLFKKN